MNCHPVKSFLHPQCLSVDWSIKKRLVIQWSNIVRHHTHRHQWCDVWLQSVCFWWFRCWKEWKGSFPKSGHRANSTGYDGSLAMAATVQQTFESTNNKLCNQLVDSYRFFISVSFGVVWTSPIYRGIRSSVARLGAHPMAVTVKQSRW